jgi:hypothetical protein
MSEVKISSCDNCSKRVDDCYDAVGWVQVRSIGAISISEGRKRDGCAKTRFFSGTDNGLDFCSIDCFVKWIKSQKAFV